MVNKFITGERHITNVDIELAGYYFPVLCDAATNAHLHSYWDVIKEARSRNPITQALENARPISIGRRFEFIRLFTIDFNLPDLTSWSVNSKYMNSREYWADFNPYIERTNSNQINWEAQKTDWENHLKYQIPYWRPYSCRKSLSKMAEEARTHNCPPIRTS